MSDINISLGSIKVATANKHEVQLPKGNYTFKAACGSCTTIQGIKDDKLAFTFIPNSTGVQTKQIYVYNLDGSLAHTVNFTADVQ
jgi:hypothetical protein